MKIRLGQLNVTIGDLKGNLSLIEETLADAENGNVDILVLPELVVCGYPPMDLIERTQFLEAVYEVNNRIISQTQNTAVLFGSITPNRQDVGKACYNSAIFAQKGKVLAEVHKTLLPTYDVYDELRYFEPGKVFECVPFEGQKLGITICEDIWHNFELPYITYEQNPIEELANLGADAIFNLSASPYTRNKPLRRQKMLQSHAQKSNLPIFYSNQVGGNTELISDGDSMAIDAHTNVVARASLFKEETVDVVWNTDENSLEASADQLAEIPSKIEQVFNGLVMGLRDYLHKTGVADKVIVGLSGGIDSALVAAIATEALGSQNVVGITMPSEFSSEGSITDSEKLAENLQIKCHKIAIKDIYNQFNTSLKSLFKDTSFGVTEENLQPRIRGTLLMAYSNKFGHMLLNTGNKSELATGYSTLYGDMAGGLGVIADLYKKDVYKMAHWLNNYYFKREVIPTSTLEKPPSAELRPNQRDADNLPEYEVLDAILQAYIEEQCSNQEIADRGYDIGTVKQVTALVDRMEYKRFQAVPALKMSDKAFGTGWRFPLVQQWTTNRA